MVIFTMKSKTMDTLNTEMNKQAESVAWESYGDAKYQRVLKWCMNSSLM